MIRGALVLEGGALRCLFSAGVVDVMMEHGLEFEYVNGVSSGSLCGLNYISKQIGRTAKVNWDYVNDKRYLGMRNLLQDGSIFNFDFLFGDITEELIPMDKKTFEESKQRYVAVATNCNTGDAEFFEKGKCTDMLMAARASCSMPLLSKEVEIDGQTYLDGGIALPIAYQKALDEGYEKVVVVLTRDVSYRKPGVRHAKLSAKHKMYKKQYGKYPNLLEKLYRIPEHYNEMQEEMLQLEKEGKIFILRPEVPVTISRVEKDEGKLKELYAQGRSYMEKRMSELEAYLED